MANRVAAIWAKAVGKAKADTAINDRGLLARYAESGDQAAFAAVVSRHSAMVHGVCRRVLHSHADADDACQAVFLILAQRANRVRWQSSIANWLYSTARKVSQNAHLASTRRTKRENSAAVPELFIPEDHLTGRELLAALDEELEHLPARYREPLVLCYLEELTRDEAAARLGIPLATLKSQLERGRKKLAEALTARGCELGMALLATVATSSAGASSPRLVESILTAVGGLPSSAAVLLAREVAMTRLLTKTKLAVLSVVGFAALGVGYAASMPVAEEPQQPSAAQTDKPEKPPMQANAPGLTQPIEASGTITIRVADPEGKPVHGATIYRWRYSFPINLEPPLESTLGKTDANGKFVAAFNPLFENTSFHATAEGFCSSSSGDLTSTQDIELRLAKQLPIKGRLLDLQGKPIANAKVTVLAVSGTANDDLTTVYDAYRVYFGLPLASLPKRLDGRATGSPKGTITNSDGRFELMDVGIHRVVELEFEAPGLETDRATVFADPEFAKRTKPPSDNEKRMSVTIGMFDFRTVIYGPEFTHAVRPEHVLSGSVTDAITGKPLAGVTVAGVAGTTGQKLWDGRVETVTDATGRFKLRGLIKAKKRFLQVQGNDKAPYLDALVEVMDTEGYAPAKMDVKLQPAVLVEGVLVNQATATPVRGSVSWFPLKGNPQIPLSCCPAKTGDKGRFQLRVPSGPGVLLAHALQYETNTAFCPIRVREEDKKYLRSRLKSKDRDPQKYDDNNEYFDTNLLAPLFSENGITYIETNLTTTLRSDNGYAIINPEPLTKTLAVKIEFNPGKAVTLNLTDPEGRSLGGVMLVGQGPYSSQRTFAESEITVGGIDPKGNPIQFYLLHLDRNLCGELKVKGDEDGPIAVKMKPCGSVTGRVVDHSGKPVYAGQISFSNTDTNHINLPNRRLFNATAEIDTDADGKFAFPHMLPDLEYHFYLTKPVLAPAMSVTLKPGENKDIGDIKLQDPKKQADQ